MTTQRIAGETQRIPSPRTTRRFGAFTALARRRTWSELLYAVLGLPIGVATFAFTAAAASAGASVAVTVIGLPLVAVTGLASRWLGSKLRSLANTMIGTDVPPAQPFRAKPGVLGWIRSCMTDRTAWRAQFYLLLKLPVGVATFTAAVTLYASGLVGLTYWAWRPVTGCDSGNGAACHQGPKFGNHYLDTPYGVLLTLFAGVVLLLLAPLAIRALLTVDKLLVTKLLGPSRCATQLRHSVPVDDSATTTLMRRL